MTWNGKGSTSAWRKTRALVLTRDQYQCRLQLPGCTGRATEVHHTIGRGWSESTEHLLAACRDCNNKIGNPQDHKDPEPVVRTKW